MAKKNLQKIDLPVKAAEVIATTEKRLQELVKNSKLNIPANYSVGNAFRAAYLALQEITDKDGKPALSVCTQSSIINALLKMILYGLNPIKSQCDFIVYGNKLICQPEYFGEELMAKRIDPRIDHIVAEVIYAGDKFKYEIVNGKKVITSHVQDFLSINKDNIVGGYGFTVDKKGNQLSSAEIMTIAQIKQAWKQSKTYPVTDGGDIKPKSTHYKFTEEMVRRTLIRKVCKRIINTSDDSHLFQDIKEIAKKEIETETATKPLDFDMEIEAETVEPAEQNPETISASQDEQEEENKQIIDSAKVQEILEKIEAVSDYQSLCSVVEPEEIENFEEAEKEKIRAEYKKKLIEINDKDLVDIQSVLDSAGDAAELEDLWKAMEKLLKKRAPSVQERAKALYEERLRALRD